MDRPMKMNFGCGPRAAEGWHNVDVHAYPGVDVQDIRDGFPFADGCFDGIVANHSLQCLAGHELDPAVAELRRVLRPGGRLRIIVPDIIGAFYAWERKDERWAGFVAISEPWDLDRKFAHYLTWGGQNRTTFTPIQLCDLLYRNGFLPVDSDPKWSWLHQLDSRPGESLIAEVIKP